MNCDILHDKYLTNRKEIRFQPPINFVFSYYCSSISFLRKRSREQRAHTHTYQSAFLKIDTQLWLIRNTFVRWNVCTCKQTPASAIYDDDNNKPTPNGLMKIKFKRRKKQNG